jgi:hypothetical protein
LLSQKFLWRCVPLVLIGLAAALLLWGRAPDAFARPQFFAEDLAIFWPQWRSLGIASFWTPYGGYLNLAPRLGAALAAILPYSLQPAGYLGMAVVATAWTAMSIVSARLPRGLGAALALSILLVPHDGEVWASLVNMQWIMACALPVIAATGAPRSAGARTNQLAFLSIAGLTGPFSAVALPIWIARGLVTYRNRDRYGLTVAAIGMLAGLIQAAFLILTSEAPSPAGEPDPAAMTLAFIERFGLEYLSSISYVIGTGLFVYLLLSPALNEGRGQRLYFLIFAVLLMVPVFIKFYRMPELIIARSVAGRYFYIPSVMLLWTAISLAWVRRVPTLIAGVVATLLIFTAASKHFQRTARVFFPDWQQKSAQIGMDTQIVQFSPGWSVAIPASAGR